MSLHQLSPGSWRLGPYPPFRSSPFQPSLLLSLPKRLRLEHPGSSLTVGCSRHISTLLGLHVSPVLLSLPSAQPLLHEHQQQNKHQRLGRFFTYMKKQVISVNYALAEMGCAFSVVGEKCMRTLQPEGHSPSPTFRAAYLSIKHFKKIQEELCFTTLLREWINSCVNKMYKMLKSLGRRGGREKKKTSSRGNKGMLEKGLVNSFLGTLFVTGIRRGQQKCTILLLHQIKTNSNISRDIGVSCRRQHSHALSSNLVLGNYSMGN